MIAAFPMLRKFPTLGKTPRTNALCFDPAYGPESLQTREPASGIQKIIPVGLLLLFLLWAPGARAAITMQAGDQPAMSGPDEPAAVEGPTLGDTEMRTAPRPDTVPPADDANVNIIVDPFSWYWPSPPPPPPGPRFGPSPMPGPIPEPRRGPPGPYWQPRSEPTPPPRPTPPSLGPRDSFGPPQGTPPSPFGGGRGGRF